MRLRIPVSICVLAALLVGGCNRAEDYEKRSVAKVNEMTSTLKTVKDEASAKAAAPIFAQQVEDFKKLRDEGNSVRVSQEELDKFKAEIMAAATSVRTELDRIKAANLLAPLEPSIQEFAKIK